MKAALALARLSGVTVRFADLGQWSQHTLRAEYDAILREIRINVRGVAGLSVDDVEKFIARAIGHELYHHREASGEVPLLCDRRARESAADAFAGSLLEESV